VTETGERLGDVIARDRDALLGEEAVSGSALLVKWLDAGDDLSLQIHPEDDYIGLTPGETGKLEAWYVVASEPGAGLRSPGCTSPDSRASPISVSTA